MSDRTASRYRGYQALAIGLLALICLVAIAGLVLSAATAAEAQAGGVIHACVNQNGLIRIVSSGDVCRNNETPVQWNVKGPVGPQGPAGPPGPAGVNELFTTAAGGNNPIFPTGNETSRVARLNVEGGSYLVLGTAVIGNLSNYKVDAVCLLQPSSSESSVPIGQVRLLESERSTGNIAGHGGNPNDQLVLRSVHGGNGLYDSHPGW